MQKYNSILLNSVWKPRANISFVISECHEITKQKYQKSTVAKFMFCQRNNRYKRGSERTKPDWLLYILPSSIQRHFRVFKLFFFIRVIVLISYFVCVCLWGMCLNFVTLAECISQHHGNFNSFTMWQHYINIITFARDFLYDFFFFSFFARAPAHSISYAIHDVWMPFSRFFIFRFPIALYKRIALSWKCIF